VGFEGHVFEQFFHYYAAVGRRPGRPIEISVDDSKEVGEGG
jgi:hypothetical protein